MWFLPPSVSAGAVAIALLLSHQATAIEDGSDQLSSYLAAHPVPTKSAVSVVINNSTISPELVNLVLSQCPAGCDESGSDPGNWTLYPRLGRLSMCNQTMLLNFNLFTSLRNDETVRACTVGFTGGGRSAGSSTPAASCLPKGNLTQVQDSLQLAFNETNTPASMEDFEAASKQLAAALSQRDSNCTDITLFTYSNSVALGLYAGSGVRAIPASVIQQFITKIKSTGFSNSAVVQLCSKDGRSSKYSFGIAASGDRDISYVQDAVAAWTSGECIASHDNVESWQDITFSVPSPISNGTDRDSTAGLGNSTAGTILLRSRQSNIIQQRALCRTIKVVDKDSCE